MLWFAYRIWAMTGRNKLIGGILALTIAGEFCHGVLSVVWVALHGRKYLNYLTGRVRTHLFLVEPFPEIDLDPFKLCIYKAWKVGELMYNNLSTFFGTSSSPSLRHCFTWEFWRASHSTHSISWHDRSSCVLGHFDYSQEIKEDQISGHAQHLGHYSARLD